MATIVCKVCRGDPPNYDVWNPVTREIDHYHKECLPEDIKYEAAVFA